MIVQKYKDMLQGKSVIRQLSEFATARGAEIGYENVFDYSLGNPSVPRTAAVYGYNDPPAAGKGSYGAARVQPEPGDPRREG